MRPTSFFPLYWRGTKGEARTKLLWEAAGGQTNQTRPKSFFPLYWRGTKGEAGDKIVQGNREAGTKLLAGAGRPKTFY